MEQKTGISYFGKFEKDYVLGLVYDEPKPTQIPVPLHLKRWPFERSNSLPPKPSQKGHMVFCITPPPSPKATPIRTTT